MRRALFTAVLVPLLLGVSPGCGSGKRGQESGANGGASSTASAEAKQAGGAILIRPANGDSGAPRPGMAFIPPGTLRVGTPLDRAPRIADEEPYAQTVEMSGFYIDLLPYPNEAGAIPTSNVSRDEAEAMCTAKGKRLCTELEWERACKGPDNAPYEYGDAYRAATCGTGVSGEEASRRPTGEHASCKSGFGVSDMHGSVWEWTDSSWGRGSKDATLGVLRGGNSVAGELVGRCANAIGRAPSKKAPTMGLRCCAGPKNVAKVDLALDGKPGLSTIASPEELHDTWEPALRTAIGTEANHFARAWRWTPVANEELVLILGCNKIGAPTCSLAVGRTFEGRAQVLASADVGHRSPLPDVARVGDARHLRIRGLDPAGTFGRDITYVYGRVEIARMNRP